MSYHNVAPMITPACQRITTGKLFILQYYNIFSSFMFIASENDCSPKNHLLLILLNYSILFRLVFAQQAVLTIVKHLFVGVIYANI